MAGRRAGVAPPAARGPGTGGRDGPSPGQRRNPGRAGPPAATGPPLRAAAWREGCSRQTGPPRRGQGERREMLRDDGAIGPPLLISHAIIASAQAVPLLSPHFLG